MIKDVRVQNQGTGVTEITEITDVHVRNQGKRIKEITDVHVRNQRKKE